eukprot:352561-Chlamydomonas_euryale.AAC.9
MLIRPASVPRRYRYNPVDSRLCGGPSGLSQRTTAQQRATLTPPPLFALRAAAAQPPLTARCERPNLARARRSLPAPSLRLIPRAVCPDAAFSLAAGRARARSNASLAGRSRSAAHAVSTCTKPQASVAFFNGTGPTKRQPSNSKLSYGFACQCCVAKRRWELGRGASSLLVRRHPHAVLEGSSGRARFSAPLPAAAAAAAATAANAAVAAGAARVTADSDRPRDAFSFIFAAVASVAATEVRYSGRRASRKRAAVKNRLNEPLPAGSAPHSPVPCPPLPASAAAQARGCLVCDILGAALDSSTSSAVASMTIACVPGVAIHGPVSQEHAARVLTPEAQAFVAALQRCFDARRRQLLAARDVRQKALDAGQMPDFLPETRAVRDGVWKAAPPAPGLVDRRVEITGGRVHERVASTDVRLEIGYETRSPLLQDACKEGGQLGCFDAQHVQSVGRLACDLAASGLRLAVQSPVENEHARAVRTSRADQVVAVGLL